MKLSFEPFMALRYLQPKRTFVSVITIISVIGVTLGVMVLILVISVMSGFQRDLREKILGMNAHLTVANGGIILNPAEVFEVIKQEPRIKAAAPFVMGPVLIEYMNKISTPYMKGIDSEKERDVSKLQNYLIQGEFDLSDDSVIIGTELSKQLGMQVGDKMIVYSPRNITSILQKQKDAKKGDEEFYLPTELTVKGIFHSGMFEYDLGFIFVNLDTAQRLYSLNGGVHGIALMTDDPFKAHEIKASLNQKLHLPIQARDWMELNQRFFQALATEKSMMFFLLTFIVLVAGFGIMSTLITVTVQKTHDIGLMKALGARSIQILWIFLSQGLIVGLLGTACGLASGLFLVEFRNPVKDILANVFHIEVFPKEIYLFDSIPALTRSSDVAVICGVSILICLLAGLIPAIRAARMEPIQALRQNY
ncbi:MAG: FtsX-like permease family protein [Verrucomicrobiota bacterium]|nr:FtsX-like permease family protein [Verrucomicrobiota bacterium]